VTRILVLSPHPDDETIGCGGTLCRHAASGDEIRVVFLTSGELGGHGLSPDKTRQLREREAKTAACILGIADCEFWRAPDGHLRARDSVVQRLAALLRQWRPQVIYTTHGGEMHPDHRAAPRILRRALSTARIGRPTVYLFEIWTPLTKMDCIVDVSPWMKIKLRAVRAYKSQCSVLRFDEAVAGLNRYRGEMHSWPGGAYAEVFAEMRP
jgi:LmbE family N-acetylglucosaminyl deacetylase